MRHAWNFNAIFIISILTCRLCFHLDTVISVIFRSCVRLINSRVIKCLLPKSRINLDCQQFFAQIEARKLQLYLFVCLRMYLCLYFHSAWMNGAIYLCLIRQAGRQKCVPWKYRNVSLAWMWSTTRNWWHIQIYISVYIFAWIYGCTVHSTKSC